MNYQQLADLDELQLSCRTEAGKTYIAEAIACYKTGAHRSAIISTWIAVVYDLVDKIRELALDGNSAANIQFSKFEDYCKNEKLPEALKFEDELLQTCKTEFDFFGPQEMTDLKRLRADRHRCAHPNLARGTSVYQPTPEQTRMHIRNAIEQVLSVAPKAGKHALELLYSEVKSSYFPTTPEEAAAILKGGPLANPKPNLFKDYTLGIMSAALKEDFTLIDVAKRIAAITAARILHPTLFSGLKEGIQAIISRTPDKGIKYLPPLLSLNPQIQDWTPEGILVKINNAIKIGPVAEHHFAIRTGLSVKTLRECSIDRIKKLNKEEIATIFKGSVKPMPEEIILAAIALLSDSPSFAASNFILSNCLLPAFPNLTDDHVCSVIHGGFSNGQVSSSSEFKTFIQTVKDKRPNLMNEVEKHSSRPNYTSVINA